MNSARLTKSQIAALRWLSGTNGAAMRLDRYGRPCDIDGKLSPYSSATVLRLIISGHCARHASYGHIGITLSGLEAIR